MNMGNLICLSIKCIYKITTQKKNIGTCFAFNVCRFSNETLYSNEARDLLVLNLALLSALQ